ncbi:claudin-10 [Otolemur garnettii]|uniref:claudin-10 n=1 Tax=Otolemur garnettii TaxID=30611 RepID=UPI00027406CF|nr:claudin-10 [Otolemur garnettii]
MASTASEIIAFLVSISGWVLVSSTLPTDYWKVSTIDGTVITTATYWANLWKTCVTDSTGVSNCKDFPSMLALDGYIQACRGLMIAAVSLGFFAAIFCLAQRKILHDLDNIHLDQRIIKPQELYELGAALFIGWAGASLCIIGGVIFCFSISDNNKTPRMGYTYNGATSVMSSRTKYHGGEGDFKAANPSKQFDKNAYV